MKLRFWQHECVDLALTHFASGYKHFLCLATPGAGKTVMAAELAARLFETEEIDLVLCFAPSTSVVSGFTVTFERRLNRRMDGKIGAAGGAYTYQAMLFLSDDFWFLLQHYRVLVIFDEVHHCSGQDAETANAWGETILLQIRDKARFSLAMTGTPWRSDEAPIVLARYLDPDSRLHCDYTYGLKKAVFDDVCRKPVITLIDVLSVKVAGDTFDSLAKALSGSDLDYSSVLQDPVAMNYALELGVKQLSDCRQTMPNAGGLVVASSVAHARKMKYILCNKFSQSAVLVTYKENDPHQLIESFKSNNVEWIVSVGMVSEGTDIPRLQVCCHLSTVRTELYFRQVLGRVLRKIGSADNEVGHLITFAEESLLNYSGRILQEIPAAEIRLKATGGDGPESKAADVISNISAVNSPENVASIRPTEIELKHEYEQSILGCDLDDSMTWSFNGAFRQKIISVFSQPFT